MNASRPASPVGPGVGDRVTSPIRAEVADASDVLDTLRNGLVRRYQLHTPPDRIIGYSRLNADALSTGVIRFQSSAPAAPANPSWDVHNRGLTLRMERPTTAMGGTSMGYFASVNVEPTTFFFERRFLLLGTFRRPVRQALAGFVPGDWAAAVLVHFAGVDYPGAGVSCQFKTVPDANGQPTDRTRLNCPSTGGGVNRAFLETTAAGQAAVNQIRSSSDPANFTLALSYDRSRSGHNSVAVLFVGGEVADWVPFDFVTLADTTVISRVSAGIGSITGVGYRVQLDLIDLQMWT